MNIFVGVCSWYLIHIPNNASAAPRLIDSLARKYKNAPEKRVPKVAPAQQTITWTNVMSHNCKKIKEELCEAYGWYIPSDQSEFAIPTDALDFGIGAVLEQRATRETCTHEIFLAESSRVL